MRSVLALLLLTGAAHGGEAPIDQTALTRLVHQDCGSCHGLTLKGGLGPDIRPETIEHYDAEVLTTVILDGIPDTAMPPWRPLITEAEAAWIAQYLLKGDTP
ncbi:c-type cytochrome [Aliiroseovarius sp. 2305UL8-7]|uniref:c-type cytochrome n=1 Tax=Aliiroseovarius conchicola TaxID=3121637 RepID=UPI003526DAFA